MGNYGKADKGFDFSSVQWKLVSQEKAEFIYGEAVERLNFLHRNIDGMTGKAMGMLSFSLPVLTALSGYFVLQWGGASIPLLAASVCAAAFLFAILVLLLLILLPRGLNPAQGEPATYFSAGYYKGGMADILKGNVQALQRCMEEDRAVLRLRGNLFRAAVVLYAAFPLAAVAAWAVATFLVHG
ncbi:MAG: hypothetical protein FWD94_01975 [Treponema sp.]|nr:hypothetical protein [Treponema sp.]